MSAAAMERALVLRMIGVVCELQTHESEAVRLYARQLVRDMTECVVEEVLSPILTLPATCLLPEEKFLRQKLQAVKV